MNDRLAECPNEDVSETSEIRIEFAVPVKLSKFEQERIVQFVTELVSKPWNQLTFGTHRMGPVEHRSVLRIGSTFQTFKNDQERDEHVAKAIRRCADCLEPQFDTPHGVTCPNGHGGADSV